MKYTNKTVYTKEVYKKISYQKSFSYELLSFKGMLMAAVLWLGARLVSQDNTQFGAWLVVIFGAVVIPVSFFIYPLIRPSFMYKQVLKETGGKELINRIELENNEIVARNNIGQKLVRSYSQVTEIRKPNGLIVILSDKFDPIYMDINGFEDCTADEALEYLYSKCTNLRKKPK